MKNKYDMLFKAANTTRQVAMLYFRLYDEVKDDTEELNRLELAHERAYNRAYDKASSRQESVRRQENAILFLD